MPGHPAPSQCCPYTPLSAPHLYTLLLHSCTAGPAPAPQFLRNHSSCAACQSPSACAPPELLLLRPRVAAARHASRARSTSAEPFPRCSLLCACSPGPTPCLQTPERPFSREPHTSAPDARAHLALVLHASPARPRSPSAELPSTGPIPVMHALPARVLPPSAPRASARPTWARLLPLQLPLRLLLQLAPRAALPLGPAHCRTGRGRPLACA
jgi:hypothetical protein